ncbi:MAG: hypothetical protein ACFCVF_17410 [Kineosporiaceae bacterium]
MPVNILVRDVPDEVRDALAAMARRRGQSLQAYLISVLEVEAALARNRAVLERAGSRPGGAADERTGELVIREIRDAGEEWPDR